LLYRGVLQTLVDKHFPAPDRSRIHRLLGLEAPAAPTPKVTKAEKAEASRKGGSSNGGGSSAMDDQEAGGSSASGKRKPSKYIHLWYKFMLADHKSKKKNKKKIKFLKSGNKFKFLLSVN
jgi:hypothetical protein